MNLFSQHTEAKKSEIIENILLYLNFTQHQTLNPKIYTKKIPNTTHLYVILSTLLLFIYLIQQKVSRRNCIKRTIMKNRNNKVRNNKVRNNKVRNYFILIG